MQATDAPVLVTGATGFTGRALTRELLRRGRSVRALVRPESSAGDLERDGVQIVRGSIQNREDVVRAAQDVHTIYHIAAVFRTAGHPDSYYRAINAGGVQNVVDAARIHGVVRTVHCSTVGVHGHVSEIPSTETSAFNPGDIYQETKLEGELIIREAIDAGLPGVIFRPAGIYGPGDLRFLKLFRAIQSGRFVMFGSGETLYHFTYIDDLVRGIILCGEHPAALGQTYILGGDGFISLNELVSDVAEALGVPAPRWRLPIWPLMAAAVACESICKPLGIDPPLHRRRAEFFVKDRAFSNAKAKGELGFAPEVTVREGMRRTALWYREQGHLPA